MKQSVWMSMSSDENIRMFQALSLWLQDSFGHVDSGFTQTSAFFKAGLTAADEQLMSSPFSHTPLSPPPSQLLSIQHTNCSSTFI